MSMRRTVAAIVLSASTMPAAAIAAEPSPKLEQHYVQAYQRAERRGADPGRDIRRDGIERPGSDRDATAGELRRSLPILRRMATPAGGSSSSASPVLEAIAACESGGDPTAVSAGGTYRGKYQFDSGTWAAVGGSGDPAAAPEAEQDRRAAALYAERGSAAWPVCG